MSRASNTNQTLFKEFLYAGAVETNKAMKFCPKQKKLLINHFNKKQSIIHQKIAVRSYYEKLGDDSRRIKIDHL